MDEKEIEEMAKDVSHACNRIVIAKKCPERLAEHLCNAGYRKAEEVRKETAREIVDLMLTEYECYIPAEIANEIAQKYDLEETDNG